VERAGDAWLDEYVPYLLYRVTNKLNARLLTRLRATKTNPARWRVLSVLRAYGTLRVNDVVEHTLMGQPTVSRVIAQLEREGRVTRSTDAEDSRVTRVTLTPKGIATFEAIVPTAMRHQEIALRGLSKADLAAVTRALTRIERNIDDADGADAGPAGR
jgi:DNA-binding MarR family transcriptional regulator